VKRFSPSPGDKYLGVGDRRHIKINYKINSLTRDNKHVRHLEEISRTYFKCMSRGCSFLIGIRIVEILVILFVLR